MTVPVVISDKHPNYAITATTDELALNLASEYIVAITSATLGIGSWDAVNRALTQIFHTGTAVLSGAEHQLDFYCDRNAA